MLPLPQPNNTTSLHFPQRIGFKYADSLSTSTWNRGTDKELSKFYKTFTNFKLSQRQKEFIKASLNELSIVTWFDH